MAQLFIDGKRVDGDQGTYPVHNPARPDEVAHEAPSASLAQLDAAVTAARKARVDWAATPVAERSAQVAEIGEALMAASGDGELATFLVREHGKTKAEADFEVFSPAGLAGIIGPVAEEALAPWAAEEPGGPEVTREPFGVVGIILPFNWPLGVMGLKVFPALLAGNTVVVKAPPSCPGAVLDAMALVGEHLPAGVVNTVNSPEVELGEGLVTHDGVDMVSFTGGASTGSKVMAAAAPQLKPVLLELGGNDAAVVAPDIEPDDALAERIYEGSFMTSGQVCMAIKRLYVHRDRYDDFVGSLVERTAQNVVGDGLAEGVTMGPVHTAAGRDFAEGLLSEAEQAGAKVHRPATVRPEDAGSGGYFVTPAVVEGAPADAGIIRQEQFAPALPVIAYDDLEDAVAQANDTEYGLCASAWSNDEGTAESIAHRLEAGTVWINHHSISAMDPRTPFGGWKQSGIGRELGADGILGYTQPRSLVRHQLP